MDTHEHKYSEPKLYPITKQLQRNYIGTPGDRAFLARKCESCPRVRPFDYGLIEDMKAKFKEMEKKHGTHT